MSKRNYGQYCTVARALDAVGERWTLLVVRELLTGPKRFKDLLEGLPGIGTNLLATRLKDLEGNGILRRATLPTPAGSKVYELTGLGRELEQVVMALSQWGSKLLGSPRRDEDLRPAWAVVAVKSGLDLRAVTGPEGVEGTLAFRVSEEDFHVSIRDGEAEAHPLPAREPVLTLSGDTETFLALASGQLEPAAALESKAIQAEGDQDALSRCLAMFKLPTYA